MKIHEVAYTRRYRAGYEAGLRHAIDTLRYHSGAYARAATDGFDRMLGAPGTAEISRAALDHMASVLETRIAMDRHADEQTPKEKP